MLTIDDIEKPPFNFPCLLGGRPIHSQERILVRSPFTGELVGSVPKLRQEDALLAISAASQKSLCLSRHARGQILLRAAERIAREKAPIARLITWESGLCLKDTLHEVSRSLDVLRFAAAEALRDDGASYSFDVSENGRDRRGHTLREPLRIITAITPFNHPLNQVVHKIAPSVATGNRMILKPSERTPLSALYFAAILADAGLPPEMLSVLTGDPEVLGPVLITHPDVELVMFTGGVDIGKRIAKSIGYRRVVLELGGNDPLIVLADADLDEAVRLAVAGAYKNSGQRCTAVKRVLVSREIADAFAERLVHATLALKVGDPMDPATDVGTVISEASAQSLERAATETIADGARLLLGNRRAGAQYWPTVLDHVRPDSRSVQTETFGPHAPILRFGSLDEAIEIANGTPYGLSAGVCTNDLRAAHRLVRELRCGTVNVREVPGYRSEASPFGGIRDSGLGVKEGVVHAMIAMTHTKLYTIPWE